MKTKLGRKIIHKNNLVQELKQRDVDELALVRKVLSQEQEIQELSGLVMQLMIMDTDQLIEYMVDRYECGESEMNFKPTPQSAVVEMRE